MEPTQFLPSSRNKRHLASMAAVYLIFMASLGLAAPQLEPNVKAQSQANYDRLPLSFEVNQGQTDAQVKFLTRGQGYALFLTPTEAVLSLKKAHAQAKASSSSIKSLSTPEKSGTVLRMSLVGANSAPEVMGKEALPGRVNYLIGKDTSKWHTKIPTYGKIVYKDVYPGVNLTYYGNQGQLEYDFVVAPGANPHNIKLAFRGTDKIDLSPTGELVLRTASGDIRMHKPILYQEIDGVRKPVNGGYVLKNGQAVGFQVAAYDAAHPLIIDPVLVYSTYLGGSGADSGSSIAVDQRGQAYVTGGTLSSDFPTENALQPMYGGGGDVFVVQFTSDGLTLRYATYLGGSDNDNGQGIAIDEQDQAAVTGFTRSSDFPVKNALQPALNGDLDAFVIKLTADGSALLYSTYLGGSGSEIGFDIALDQRGRYSVTGQTFSTDFPIENALQAVFGGGEGDAFVAQIAAKGDALLYSTYLGGRHFDTGLGIAVDNQGQVYVTGQSDGAGFPIKNPLQLTSEGKAFVTKLGAEGTLSYSTFLSGSTDGKGIAVDQKGQAYVAGNTSSTDFSVVNALQPKYGGQSDAFVAKLNRQGSALVYSTYLGGSNRDDGMGIAVDHQGRAYVTGLTYSSDFPIKNALQSTLNGTSDAFIVQLTADGSALRYSTYLGGSGDDVGNGIAVNQRGKAYVAGETRSTDFPTKSALQPASGGGLSDAFVVKIGSDD